MSPRALPPLTAGGPPPRKRGTVACLVPPGTRSFFVPCSVGTSTSAPRIASATVIGTSTSKLSPLRLKIGDSLTWQTTYRSPAGPPRRPASPLPGRRIFDPSLTPAGGLARDFFCSRRPPAPGRGALGRRARARAAAPRGGVEDVRQDVGERAEVGAAGARPAAAAAAERRSEHR